MRVESEPSDARVRVGTPRDAEDDEDDAPSEREPERRRARG